MSPFPVSGLCLIQYYMYSTVDCCMEKKTIQHTTSTVIQKLSFIQHFQSCFGNRKNSDLNIMSCCYACSLSVWNISIVYLNSLFNAFWLQFLNNTEGESDLDRVIKRPVFSNNVSVTNCSQKRVEKRDNQIQIYNILFATSFYTRTMNV